MPASDTGIPGNPAKQLGNFQGAEWNPQANEFLILEGETQPLEAVLYDGKRGQKVREIL
jgi:hypothetical protein